ncbi:MAG: hypothetical protein IID33_03410 [Planctomycetes bacterium]|nr:hypothetical protein [Planctomycetota bacterium]
MPLDRESEAYVLAMTFLLRTPGAHVERVICDPARDVPRPLEELFARWRRAREVVLSGDLMRTLAELDEQAVYSVLNTCIARLLRPIAAKHDPRNREQRPRRNQSKANP